MILIVWISNLNSFCVPTAKCWSNHCIMLYKPGRMKLWIRVVASPLSSWTVHIMNPKAHKQSPVWAKVFLTSGLWNQSNVSVKADSYQGWNILTEVLSRRTSSRFSSERNAISRTPSRLKKYCYFWFLKIIGNYYSCKIRRTFYNS